MRPSAITSARVAIACGGTGGHLFPGLAVAEQLVQRGCAVTLMISPKEIDQRSVRQAKNVEVVTLPAIGLTRGQGPAFLLAFRKSYSLAKGRFRSNPPQAVLAMGGFTSAPPVLAAKRIGTRTFLHESNTIPGRANRWLSWITEKAFVGFPVAAARLHAGQVVITGTPVRPQFKRLDAATCRKALGLDPSQPVVLVMGGSQGAAGINRLVEGVLPVLASAAPHWQWIHVAGSSEAEQVQKAHSASHFRSIVVPFMEEMELAMGSATVAISRAGASSLAELAAVQLPSILIPYPPAADNHQLHNARAFEQSGAARVLEQAIATPQQLAGMLSELVSDAAARLSQLSALAKWHRPDAAKEIARLILEAVGVRAGEVKPANSIPGNPPSPGSGSMNTCSVTSVGGEILAMPNVLRNRPIGRPSIVSFERVL